MEESTENPTKHSSLAGLLRGNLIEVERRSERRRVCLRSHCRRGTSSRGRRRTDKIMVGLARRWGRPAGDFTILTNFLPGGLIKSVESSKVREGIQ
jgi:hypothetical protein